MNRRSFGARAAGSLLAIATVGALAAGCVRWTIVRQAAPSPLNAGSKFVLEPMHWENTQVGGKSEAEYFSGKEPEQQQSYGADKGETTGLFGARVKTAGAAFVNAGDPTAFLIRPTVEHWEPGFYAAVVRSNSRMDLRLQILTPQGQVVDEITVTSTAQATMTTPSSGQRMRMCGEDLGNVVSKYLTQRLGGG